MGCSADATTGFGYVGPEEENLDDLSPEKFTEEMVTSGADYELIREIEERHGCTVGHAGHTDGTTQLYFIVTETERTSHYGANIIASSGYDSAWVRKLDAFLAELGIDPSKLEGPGLVLAASYG